MLMIMKFLGPLSNNHLRCARLCARNCEMIEVQYKNGSTIQENDSLFNEDLAYATGAVISSVAFLEAVINEFFQYCLFFREPWLAKLDDEILLTLCDKWKTKSFPDKKILEKYTHAYGIILKKGITNDLYIKDITDLIELRHTLVHYKPMWQTVEPTLEDPYLTIADPYDIQQLIGRFKENIFFSNSKNPFFPHRCLGAGCALWAVNSSDEFINFFFTSINVRSWVRSSF